MCWPCYGRARLCKARKAGREAITGAAAAARKEGRRPPRHRHRQQQPTPAPSRCARACNQRNHGGIKTRRIWRGLPWAAAKFISIWASNAIAICYTVLYPPKDKIPRSRSSRFHPPHFPFQPFSRHQIPRKKQPNSGCQACVLASGTIKYKLMQTANCKIVCEGSRAQLT